MFPMVGSLPLYRDARKEDARALAQLIDIAGQGIPSYLWSQQACADECPLDIGAERVLRDDVHFSYRNTVVAHVEGKIAGMLLSYRLPKPTAEELAELPHMPELLRPLVELEHRVIGSFYINALAVYEPYRRCGIGSALLAIAETRARTAGCERLSVQVFAENLEAFRLYQRCGYSVNERRPICAHDCYPYDTEVLLMTRPV